MFSKVKQQPYFTVIMRKKNTNKSNDIDVF